MKLSRCAAQGETASVWLVLLALLASCSLETTGSGDFSLSADDDTSVGADAEDPYDDGSDDNGSNGDADDDGGNGRADVDGAARPADPKDASTHGKDAGRSDGNEKCRAGNYQGSFSCKQPTVTGPPWAAGLSGNEITGSFTFRLEPTGQANTFALVGGALHSADNAFFKLDATIAASFTCGRPLQGKLTDASYTNVFGTPTPFESPFDASYDEATGAFLDGTWVVKNDIAIQCNGTWSATRSD